jgi:signal transduction histidine kinase
MTTPLRLLIVEDSEDDARLLIRELTKSGYDPDYERVDTPEAMQSALASGMWDVIISDYVMPRFSGLDALRMLKESTIDIPFIIVSGNIGEVTAVEAMRAGAHDYILKGNLARLAPAIERETVDAENRRKRRQADEELALLHKTLEVRVVEMVTDLRRKDQILIQQSRLAAMGEMIGNIAHQWRNPLNNAALIIQNLRSEYDSGTLTHKGIHSDISEAMAVIMHLSDTINDFRNFFREDREKREFPIGKSVDSAMTLVAATLSNNNIQIEIECSDEVTAFGYQNEYAQALLNIISNSREAALERRTTNPHISIRITRENGRSVLYVRDNCGGIPDDVMPKIFDPYFTTRGPDRGTGIGLYMSKVIIEQNMDGHLTACNVEDGAEFRIEV